MPAQKQQVTSIDEYINTFPAEVQRILEKILTTVRKAAPEAEETISYQMPTFKMNGKYLVYFAAWKDHIAFYPLPTGNEALKELAPYQGAKGAVHFPIDKPIPLGLVKKIVAFRLQENGEKRK